MKKKRMYTMFFPFLNSSKKLLFFGIFLLSCFYGYGQDLSIENITEDEDVGTMVFTVTLNGDVPGGTSVNYSFIDVSATGGVDYDNTIGPTLFFLGNDGETQTITVAITDDFIDEDNEDFTVQLGVPSNGVSLSRGGDARGRILDNDTVGINISPISGNTTEAGGQATFLFTLTSQPTADVTIAIDQYDVTETFGPATIVLSPTSWNTGVPLIVTGVDDDFIDGDIVDNIRTGDVTSGDSFYDDLNGGDVVNLVVTNEDDDVAGVNISAISGNTTEAGGTATFTVSLDSQPTANVAIALSSSDSSEGTVPVSIIKTAANWNANTQVTITGVDDDIVDGDVIYTIITGNVTSFDPNYNALGGGSIPDFQVTNDDDDAVGITISPISGNTTEAGGTATFTVSLDSQPTANVLIELSSNDVSEGTVPVSVTKTPGNWNANTTVTVTGVDDNIVDGDVIYTIVTGNITSADPNYNALVGGSIPNLQVTNEDDDTVGITISPINGNTNEAGGTATFTVSLDSQPTADVNIALSSSDPSEGTVPISVTKTPGNWNANTIVTVTGVDDNIVDGNVGYTIVTGNVTSGDANYNALNGAAVADITVTNTDNDTAIITLADKAENEDIISGNLIFDATLDIAVDGGFTVGYTFTNGTAIGGGTDFTGIPGTLTFVGDAGEVQTITVAIVDDQLLEQTEDFTVQLAAPSNLAVTLAGGGTATGSINDDDNCAPAPILDTSVSTSFCDVIDVNLNDYTSTPAPSGTVLTWSTLSNPLNENAYLTPSQVANPPNDGSYFGFFLDTNGTPNDFSDDCASGVMEVELILNTSPTLTGFTDGERCGTGTVTLMAQGSGAASLVWYASEDSDTPLFTGENFVTDEISSTTTYYVAALENNCTSDRQAVVALVGEASTTGTATNGAACNVTTNGPTLIDLDDRLTGASVGVWSVTTDISNSITINSDNEIDFAGRISGDYVFTFTTTAFTAPCTEETVDVTISVSDCNTDDDLDGLVTGQEVVLGTDPNNPDTDGDGIEDGVEAGTDLNNPLDEDDDGIIDALDSNILDTDGDGVNDQQDPANENPCIPDNSSADCPVDLEITKTADTLAALIGDTVTFTITVTNLTDKVTEVAKVGDLLENGFEYVSQSASNGTYDEVTGEWDIENLPALGTATLDIVVTLVEGDSYTNTAQLLESTPVDDNASNDVSEPVVIETTIVEGVDLLIEKRAIPSTVLIGDNVVFELKVTNESVSDIVTNIRISEVLDVNFEFVSAETDFGTFDELNGEWLIPQLELGEEAVLLITARAPRLGIFENTASYISSSPRDGDAANNSETVRVEVIEKTEASPGFLYNQFSPNGNGQNEVLRINLEEPQTGIDVSILYSISIFDRYGGQVFEVQNANSGDVWDGTYEGKEAPEGTYFYVLKYSINNGDEVTAKGWIQLIR